MCKAVVAGKDEIAATQHLDTLASFSHICTLLHNPFVNQSRYLLHEKTGLVERIHLVLRVLHLHSQGLCQEASDTTRHMCKYTINHLKSLHRRPN